MTGCVVCDAIADIPTKRRCTKRDAVELAAMLVAQRTLDDSRGVLEGLCFDHKRTMSRAVAWAERLAEVEGGAR